MRRTHRSAAVLLSGLMLASGGALAADPPYLSDLPRLYPQIQSLWTASLPRAVTLPPWVRRFDGTVTPIRAVTIDGQAWRFGTACMPHDCGSNMLGLLFSPQRNKVFGVASLAGTNDAATVMAIGDMDARTMGCIRFFVDRYDSTDCPAR